MITLDRLRYFVEVANLEHVGRAAERLAVSPSVLSSAIQTLEAELKVELFERKNNRIRLSLDGHQLLEKARTILGQVENLTKSDTELKGHLRVGASHILMSEILSGRMVKLLNAHPKLTSELISLDTGLAIAGVLNGSLDLALVFSPFGHHDIAERVIERGQFAITVKKNHPILKLTPAKRIEMLNQLPAITFRASTGPNICEDHPVFRKFGIIPKHTYFFDNDFVARDILLKTQGWAFLPDMIVKTFHKDLVPLPMGRGWEAPMNVSVITNKLVTQKPAIQTLLQEF